MNPLRYLETPIAMLMRWSKFRQSPVKPDPADWFHIKYLALQKLVLASRVLVVEKPDDPQLDDIKAALEYYKDYWN